VQTDSLDLSELDFYLGQLTPQQLEELYSSIADYKRPLVHIDEFLDSDKYLGNFFQGGLFPYWRNFYREIYPSPYYNPYWLIALRGCLTGDTKIPLLNGTHERLDQIVNKFSLDKDLWVFSFNRQNKSFEPSRVINAFSTGIKEIYEITLDNGEKIKCTSCHRFLSRDNKWISIDNGLKEGISLYPYRYDESTGYHWFINPENNRWTARYDVVGRWKSLKKKIDHIHHKNFNKLDDRPSNLACLSKKVHFDFHKKLGVKILENWRLRIW